MLFPQLLLLAHVAASCFHSLHHQKPPPLLPPPPPAIRDTEGLVQCFISRGWLAVSNMFSTDTTQEQMVPIWKAEAAWFSRTLPISQQWSIMVAMMFRFAVLCSFLCNFFPVSAGFCQGVHQSGFVRRDGTYQGNIGKLLGFKWGVGWRGGGPWACSCGPLASAGLFE